MLKHMSLRAFSRNLLILSTLAIFCYLLEFHNTALQRSKNIITKPTIQNTQIPLIIHQVSRSNTSSLLTTDIPVKVWVDEDLHELVDTRYPSLSEWFRRLNPGVLKADLGRYLIIYEFGGLYMDSDVLLNVDPRKWIKDEHHQETPIRAILGIEKDSSGVSDWPKWFAREIQWCQWTFAFAPRHPLLKKVIDMSIARLQSNPIVPDGSNRMTYILDNTGPGLFSDAFYSYMEENHGLQLKDFAKLDDRRQIDDVLVLNGQAFGSFRGDPQDPRILVRHLYRGSWK